MSEEKSPITAPSSVDALLIELRNLIQDARQRVAQTINGALTFTYWRIGKRLLAENLTEGRGEYGRQILATLSRQLEVEFGKGFSYSSLTRMARFAEIFPDESIVAALMQQLTWTHFQVLIPVKDPLAREFYAEMCRVERWSVRALRQKIAGMLFERTALSKNSDQLIRDELAQLRDAGRMTPDLLFYHRRLRRLVVIDLKLESFQPAHTGQMELYLRCLDKHERLSGEESPIGLILCAGADAEQIELLQLEDKSIRVAEYLTELPPLETLRERLHRAIALAREQASAREANDGKHELP